MYIYSYNMYDGKSKYAFNIHMYMRKRKQNKKQEKR